MEEESNRRYLDRLKDKFSEWLHIEDENLLYTLAAVKTSHRIPGDPLWLMIIGPSSGGKSEYLRAFHQDGEKNLDDLTENTFVSGFRPGKNKDGEDNEIIHFAQEIKDKVWYIYDLSILMSKHHDERSKILSQLRMIYDGEITKRYGTGKEERINTGQNTLICGSTNAIDNTILEDQALGTRFIHYRIPKSNRYAMMHKIDENTDQMDLMRDELHKAVRVFEHKIQVKPYFLSEIDNNNLQIMSNLSTLLRTSVSYDRSGEPSNIAYPEEPGRFYKEIKKMYMSYKIIGLTDDEALRAIRKVCVDNINPIRTKVLEQLYLTKRNNGWDHNLTTTSVHTRTGLGKKTIKMHMHALHLLGMVDYSVVEDQYGRTIKDKWSLLDTNLDLLFSEGVKTYPGKTLFQLYQKCKLT